MITKDFDMEKLPDDMEMVRVMFGFETLIEARWYAMKRKEASQKKMLLGILMSKAHVTDLVELKLLLHSLINGYENDMYRALIQYAETGEDVDFGSSRVMSRVYEKAKQMVERRIMS